MHKELKESQTACPTIFQPLGTIEWHGVHNVVGVDSLKAHALCVRAAQKGGFRRRTLICQKNDNLENCVLKFNMVS